MAGVPGLIPGSGAKKKPYVAPKPKGGKPDGRMGGYDPEVGKSRKPGERVRTPEPQLPRPKDPQGKDIPPRGKDPGTRTPEEQERANSAKSQPGQGAPTGGTGRDADGGKGRTQFEDDRRNGNAGGKDRPPIYKPQDDGERNGYTGRSRAVGAGRAAAFGQVIDKRTVKQKLKDASSRR